MKQIYKHLLTAFAVVGTCSALPAAAQSVDFRPSNTQGVVLSKQVQPQVAQNTRSAFSPADNPMERRDYDNYTWKSLGNARYRDNFLSSIFAFKSYEYDVEVQEAQEIKGLYRLVNPYGAAYPESVYLGPDSSNNTYDAEVDEYMYIHAELMDQESGYCPYVWIDYMESTWNPTALIEKDYGHIELSSMAFSYYLDQKKTISEAYVDGMCGTMRDGVITFPANRLMVRLSNYNVDDKTGVARWQTANMDGMFRLILPEGELYEIAASAPQLCAKDNKVKINLEYEGTPLVKWTLVEGRKDFASFTDSEWESFAYRLADFGNELERGQKEVTVTVPSDGAHAFFAVTVDRDGYPRYASTYMVYGHYDDPDNWESLGMTTWMDDLSPRLRYIEGKPEAVETLEAEIQISKDNRWIRLVNPFANHSMKELFTHPNDHNHYMRFLIRKDNWVEMPLASFGLSSEAGQLVGGDFAEYYRNQTTKTEDKIFEEGAFGWISEENGEKWIRYDEGALTGHFLPLSMPGASWMYTNDNNMFGVKVPEEVFTRREASGINANIVDADAPVEYFNLQGIRIANPEKGQTVIKRQGAKVSKHVVK